MWIGIMLPTKDDKPDYQAMALLISAIQKLVIKGVIHYTDQKIAAARKAVDKNKSDSIIVV